MNIRDKKVQYHVKCKRYEGEGNAKQDSIPHNNAMS